MHLVYPATLSWRARYQAALTAAARESDPVTGWDFACGGPEYVDPDGARWIDAGGGDPGITAELASRMAALAVPNYPTAARFLERIPDEWKPAPVDEVT